MKVRIDSAPGSATSGTEGLPRGNPGSRRSAWLASCALLTGVVFLSASPAAAAGAAAAKDAPTDLGEVTVTARRIVENVQDVPVAVSVFSGEKMSELKINNPMDVVKLAPSLQTGHSTGGFSSFDPVIRGQGRSSIGAYASVPVVFAEIPLMEASFYDLQSFQVLKGPQGTLFGAGSTGGALLITPRKPSDQWSAYLTTEMGNHNSHTVEGAIGGPIVGDKLMFRIATNYRVREGYTKAYPSYAGVRELASSENYDNVNKFELRASITFRPFDRLEDNLVYLYSRNQNRDSAVAQYSDPYYLNVNTRNLVPAADPANAARWQATTGVAPIAGKTIGQYVAESGVNQIAMGPRAIVFNYDRNHDTLYQGISNILKFDVSDNLTIRNITGMYWARNRGAVLDTDASDLPTIDTTAIKNPPPGGDAWTGGWPSRTWTNEFQFQGKLFDRLQWQAGYFYERQQSREFQGPTGTIIVFPTFQSLINTPATCAAFGVPAGTRCTSVTRALNWDDGLYAQGTLSVTDKLKLTVGVRRTRDYRAVETTAGNAYFGFVNGVEIPLSQFTGQFPGATITKSVNVPGKATTYNVTGDYHLTDDILVYAATRTGYKPGGINQNAPVDNPKRFFTPEKIRDVEIGVKADYEIMGMKARSDVAVYYDWYDNIQRSTLIPGSALTVTDNQANATIAGVEWEQTLIPSKWLEFHGYFAYTDAKYVGWIENTTCAADFFRLQCVGQPTTTVVHIDHSAGSLTVGNNAAINFHPEGFAATSKWRFGINPTVHLDELTGGEEVSVSGNYYYRTEFVITNNAHALFAGNPNVGTIKCLLKCTIDPLTFAGYGILDLRADWRNIMGTKVSWNVAITNVFDKVGSAGNSGGLTIAGTVNAFVNEPRMITTAISMKF